MYTSEQVGKATGLTPRRVDHILRTHLIDHPDPTPGTGQPRRFTREQVERIARIAALTEAGLTLKKAAQLQDTPDYAHGPVKIIFSAKKIAEALTETLDAPREVTP